MRGGRSVGDPPATAVLAAVIEQAPAVQLLTPHIIRISVVASGALQGPGLARVQVPRALGSSHGATSSSLGLVGYDIAVASGLVATDVVLTAMDPTAAVANATGEPEQR